MANAAVNANKAEKAIKAGKNYYSNSLSSLNSRSSLFNSYVVILILGCVVFMDSVSLADGLRQEQIKYWTPTDTEKILLAAQRTQFGKFFTYYSRAVSLYEAAQKSQPRNWFKE